MTQDAQGLKGQLAFLDSQVSKVPKAEREMLGFQVSRVHLATLVKEELQGSQDHQDSLGLQAVQVPQDGKGSEETWGLQGQLG